MSPRSNAARAQAIRSTIIIILLAILILLFAAVSVWAIFFREPAEVKDPSLAPDYAPIQTDTNATDIENDSTDKLDAPEGGGAVGLTYSNVVTVDLSDKTVTLFFQNPGRSRSDMVLQIVVQDQVLAQSDLLLPGKQLRNLPLNETVVSMLQQGGYKGIFLVSFYDPETGEKANLDTQVEITVNVTE